MMEQKNSEILTKNGPSSPVLSKKDLSRTSLNMKPSNAVSKKMIATDTPQLRTIVSFHSQQGSSNPQLRPQIAKKKLEITDERLMKPSKLSNHRSQSEIREEHTNSKYETTHQSFNTTVRQSLNESPDLKLYGGSKTSRLYQNVFSNDFSKTYAELLTNIGAQAEIKSGD